MVELGKLAVFPAAIVVVRTPENEELPLIMLIDSGATVSAMPKSIASLLGIKLKTGKPIHIFGIGGKSIPAWRHEILATIGNTTVKLPVAFMNSNNSPRVLGREGIFDQHIVIFEEAKRQSALLGNKTEEADSVQNIISRVPLSE